MFLLQKYLCLFVLFKIGFSPAGPVRAAKELHMHQTYVRRYAERMVSGQELHSSGVSGNSHVLLLCSAQLKRLQPRSR